MNEEKERWLNIYIYTNTHTDTLTPVRLQMHTVIVKRKIVTAIERKTIAFRASRLEYT